MAAYWFITNYNQATALKQPLWKFVQKCFDVLVFSALRILFEETGLATV